MFLRICSPLDKEDYFNRLIIRPLKNGDPSGAELMRVGSYTHLIDKILIHPTGNHDPGVHPTYERGLPIPDFEPLSAADVLIDERRERRATRQVAGCECN
jgi:hypothetical protein